MTTSKKKKAERARARSLAGAAPWGSSPYAKPPPPPSYSPSIMAYDGSGDSPYAHRAGSPRGRLDNSSPREPPRGPRYDREPRGRRDSDYRQENAYAYAANRSRSRSRSPDRDERRGRHTFKESNTYRPVYDSPRGSEGSPHNHRLLVRKNDSHYSPAHQGSPTRRELLPELTTTPKPRSEHVGTKDMTSEKASKEDVSRALPKDLASRVGSKAKPAVSKETLPPKNTALPKVAALPTVTLKEIPPEKVNFTPAGPVVDDAMEVETTELAAGSEKPSVAPQQAITNNRISPTNQTAASPILNTSTTALAEVSSNSKLVSAEVLANSSKALAAIITKGSKNLADVSSLKFQEEVARKKHLKRKADYDRSLNFHEKFPATHRQQSDALARAKTQLEPIDKKLKVKYSELEQASLEATEQVIPAILSNANTGGANLQEYNNLKDHCQVLEQRCAEQEKQVKAHQEFIASFTKFQKQQELLTTSLQTELASVKKTSEASSTKSAKTTQELEGLQSQLNAAKVSNAGALKRQDQAAEKAEEAFKIQLAEVKALATEAQKSADQSSKSVQEALRRSVSLETNFNGLDSKVNSEAQKAVDFQTSSGATSTQLEQRISSNENRTGELTDAVNTLVREFTSVVTDQSTLNQNATHLQETIESQKVELEAQKFLSQNLDLQIKDLRRSRASSSTPVPAPASPAPSSAAFQAMDRRVQALETSRSPAAGSAKINEHLEELDVKVAALDSIFQAGAENVFAPIVNGLVTDVVESQVSDLTGQILKLEEQVTGLDQNRVVGTVYDQVLQALMQPTSPLNMLQTNIATINQNHNQSSQRIGNLEKALGQVINKIDSNELQIDNVRSRVDSVNTQEMYLQMSNQFSGQISRMFPNLAQTEASLEFHNARLHQVETGVKELRSSIEDVRQNATQGIRQELGDLTKKVSELPMPEELTNLRSDLDAHVKQYKEDKLINDASMNNLYAQEKESMNYRNNLHKRCDETDDRLKALEWGRESSVASSRIPTGNSNATRPSPSISNASAPKRPSPPALGQNRTTPATTQPRPGILPTQKTPSAASRLPQSATATASSSSALNSLKKRKHQDRDSISSSSSRPTTNGTSTTPGNRDQRDRDRKRSRTVPNPKDSDDGVRTPRIVDDSQDEDE